MRGLPQRCCAQKRHYLRHSDRNSSYIFKHEEERGGAYEEGLWELAGDLRVGDGEDDDVNGMW